MGWPPLFFKTDFYLNLWSETIIIIQIISRLPLKTNLEKDVLNIYALVWFKIKKKSLFFESDAKFRKATEKKSVKVYTKMILKNIV